MSAVLHDVADVAAGLALEADAFAAVETQALVWTTQTPALVCPASYRRKPGFAAAIAQSQAQGWPVYQRPTGGGAVPQGPGVSNLAIAFTADRGFGIEDGYRLITDVICAAAARELTAGATVGSFCDGAWNLSLHGQKIVGTAQRIRPLKNGLRRILAHALILTDSDVQPGAAAVNRFHKALGLPPVLAVAHTTMRRAFGTDAANPETLAQKLVARAADALATPHARHAA